MRTREKVARRRGSILVLMAISLVAICAFVALAVDIGMIAVAKTEAQNAADIAAMVGARSLDGSDTPNLATATANARAAARANKILHQQVKDSEVAVQHGSFHYNTSTETFSPQYPPPTGDNYNLTRVTVTHTRDTAFARVLGVNAFTVVANATAAHRPRDVMILLDFSGSMNNESDLWNNEGYLGVENNSPNNNDPVHPNWGHHADPAARLRNISSDPRVGKCNITDWVLGLPPLAEDFYLHSRGSASVRAFTPANAAYADTPNGDGQPMTSAGSAAKTAQDVTGSASTPFDPANYAPYNNFQGFTQGPRYWGKTFFIWPPHPDPGNPPNNVVAKDWRRRFFFHSNGTTPLDDNTKLWNETGTPGDANNPNWRTPSGNYVINYAAILDWIKNSGPNPFPTQLRGGRILYYNNIPNDIEAAAYDHTRSNSLIANPNERFWKEYIDYVIGVWRDPFGNIQRPGNPACSMGPDFAWSSVRVRAPLAGLPTGPPNGTGAWNRVDPLDNPWRPRHRLWFGPMTMVQFISDTGLLPGNAHDISMYPAKLGIAAGLEDIRNNHPNDLVSMIIFNRPRFDNEPVEAGRFSKAQFNLSRNYSAMQNALWFPPNSSVNDVRPWDANGVQTPRAYGDYTGNTCSNYGFMLAYNQMSSSTVLQAADEGGFGRKGAQRLIIFETDGMANVRANAVFDSTGGYYRLGPLDSVTPGGSAAAGVYEVVDKIVALDTDMVNGPGFGKARKPVIIHCVAFGAVVEPTAEGSQPGEVMTLLQNVSAKGSTSFPAAVDDTGHPEFYKICTGTLDERKTKLRQAFRKIMESGIPLSLVE